MHAQSHCSTYLITIPYCAVRYCTVLPYCLHYHCAVCTTTVVLLSAVPSVGLIHALRCAETTHDRDVSLMEASDLSYGTRNMTNTRIYTWKVARQSANISGYNRQ